MLNLKEFMENIYYQKLYMDFQRFCAKNMLIF